MTLLAKTSRIRNDTVRVNLLMLLFPFQIAHFAWFMLWRAPRRLLAAECWQNTFAFWGMAFRGELI